MLPFTNDPKGTATHDGSSARSEDAMLQNVLCRRAFDDADGLLNARISSKSLSRVTFESMTA
jgi:hypothetical protein